MYLLLGLLSSSTFLYSIGLFFGRISGFLRELLIAKYFKISDDSDTIILLLTVPDFINNLLSVTVLSSIILPLLSKFEQDYKNVIYFSIKKLFVVACVFLFFLICFSFFLFERKVFYFLLISMFSVIPNIISAVFVAYLNYRNDFFLPSLGTLLFNSVLIIFLLLSNNLFVFSFAIVFASFIRFISVFLKSAKISTSFFPLPSLGNFNFFSYRELFIAVLSNGIFFLMPLIDKIFASRISIGSVSILSYAEKIYLLPVSVFLTSTAVVAFPEFVKLYTHNNFKELFLKLKKSFFVSSILGFITSFIFVLFNEQIVYLIFGISSLSENDLIQVSNVNFGYIPMLLFSGGNSIILYVLYATNKIRTVFLLSLIIVILKILFNILVVFNDLDLVFIAWSTSLASLLQLLFGSLLVLRYLTKKIRV